MIRFSFLHKILVKTGNSSTCKLLLLVALIAMLAGCTTTTVTTTHLDPQTGKAVATVVTKGTVEGIAAKSYADNLPAAIEALKGMKTSVEVPLDGQAPATKGEEKSESAEGGKSPPKGRWLKISFYDSSVSAALQKALAGMQTFESPTIKGIRATGNAIKPWRWPLGMAAIADIVASKAGTHRTSFDNSFNNNKQSPVSMMNGHGSAQHLNLNNNEDHSQHDDHSDDHTDNSSHEEAP